MNAIREHRIGLIFVTLATITWSSAGFFTRLIALDYATMIAARGFFGAIGILAMMIAFNPRGWHRAFATIGRFELMYIALVVLGMVAFVGSLGLTSVAHNSVIFAMIPLIAAFLAWAFLREIPSAHALGASVLAIVGVAIMVGFGLDGGFWGDVLALVATLCMALGIVIIRRKPTISVTACSCIGSALSGLVCLPFADLGTLTAPNTVYLILFGLLNSAAGLTLYALGSRRLPAIETALLTTLDTPLAPLWVWLAFNETATPQTLLGGAIVLSAVVMHVVLSQRSHRRLSQVTPVH
jgi:drug/metabolite transporter (DMT)-like permease